ncbi:MAG: HD domain-containing phosphohydrolase [Bacillota bacterium]
MPSDSAESNGSSERSKTMSHLFVVAISIIAAWAGWVLFPSELPPLQSLIFFLALIIVTEALPIKLPRANGSVSVGFAMCYSSVLMFGPFWGGLLTALGSLRKMELTGRVPGMEVVFNRAQLFLAAVSGGLVFNLLSGGALGDSPYMFALATMAGGISYFVVNVAATVVYISLKTGLNPVSLVASDVRWMAPSYIGLMPIAYLNVAVYHAVGEMGVIFFLLPLMVGRYAFTMYNELRDVFVSTISALATALEARDPHTSGHAERVSHYAVGIAKNMKIADERVQLLQYVSILHDIGKIGISDQVLQKPGRFTSAEWSIMKEHSAIGANILSKIKALKEGASWVLYHHERYDGEGYPEGLKGEEIPIEARILAVADSFDAMVSQRPYKRAMTLEEAKREIKRCSGTQFDPEVASAFLDFIEDSELVHARFMPEAADGISEGERVQEGSLL